jgi:hypothetical protein
MQSETIKKQIVTWDCLNRKPKVTHFHPMRSGLPDRTVIPPLGLSSPTKVTPNFLGDVHWQDLFGASRPNDWSY